MSTILKFDDPVVVIESQASHRLWSTARVTFSVWKNEYKISVCRIMMTHELGTPSFDAIADDAWAELVKRAGVSSRHVVLAQTR